MNRFDFNAAAQSLLSTLKKIFTYRGRATRMEFWTFVITAGILNTLLLVIAGGLSAIHEVIGIAFLGLFFIIWIAEMLVGLALSVRRLHDIDLSGFWLLYLNPFIGLPLVFIIYLLDIDSSCSKVINNVPKVGSPWLGWILTLLLWPAGVAGVLFLLFLYPGKDAANSFGESPYSPAK